jgi:hypothetical protein
MIVDAQTGAKIVYLIARSMLHNDVAVFGSAAFAAPCSEQDVPEMWKHHEGPKKILPLILFQCLENRSPDIGAISRDRFR